MKERIMVVGFYVLLILLWGTATMCQAKTYWREQEGLSDSELYGSDEKSLFYEKSKRKKTVSRSKRHVQPYSYSKQHQMPCKETKDKEVIKQDREKEERKEKQKEGKQKVKTVSQIAIHPQKAGRYFRENVMFTIKADRKEKEEKVNVFCQYTPFQGKMNQTDLKFSQQKLSCRQRYTLQEEGQYRILACIRNDQKVIQSQEYNFVIDKTAPQIQLQKMENKCFQCIDTKFMKQGMIQDATNIKLRVWLNECEMTQRETREGSYQMQVEVTDQAGNISQAEGKVAILHRERTAEPKSLKKQLKTTPKPFQDIQKVIALMLIIIVFGYCFYDYEKRYQRKWEEENDRKK